MERILSIRFLLPKVPARKPAISSEVMESFPAVAASISSDHMSYSRWSNARKISSLVRK